jgi:hypothetical protein
VVRDISNVFFILVLLYVAIQTILGLSHETKKVVVHVIIMALLINFSMFFTKVVVDSSNMWALVFYNRIDVGNRDFTGLLKPDAATVEQKDFSGGIVQNFDPSKLLSEDFFKVYKTENQAAGSKMGLGAYIATGAAGGAVVGAGVPGAIVGGVGAAGVYGVKTAFRYFFPTKEVPTPMILAIILISGLIIFYCLRIFCSRLKLWEDYLSFGY